MKTKLAKGRANRLRPVRATVPTARRAPAASAPAAAMLPLKKLLVPVDFSPASLKVLRYAADFAGRLGAKLFLLHVVEAVPTPGEFTYLPAMDLNRDLVRTAETRLRSVARTEVSRRVTVETQVRSGRPFEEIVAAAREAGSDLILIGTHGYTGLKHVLLGSTAERVVRHARCPVLVVREGDSLNFLNPVN